MLAQALGGLRIHSRPAVELRTLFAGTVLWSGSVVYAARSPEPVRFARWRWARHPRVTEAVNVLYQDGPRQRRA